MNHIGTQIIETERLLLRRFMENDAQEIYEGYVNQDDFLYYTNKKKRTLKEEIDSLKGIDDKYNDLDYYNWLITIKDTNKIIGAIHLNVNNYKDFVSGKTTAFVYCSNIIMEILSNSFKNLSNFKNF